MKEKYTLLIERLQSTAASVLGRLTTDISGGIVLNTEFGCQKASALK